MGDWTTPQIHALLDAMWQEEVLPSLRNLRRRGCVATAKHVKASLREWCEANHRKIRDWPAAKQGEQVVPVPDDWEQVAAKIRSSVTEPRGWTGRPRKWRKPSPADPRTSIEREIAAAKKAERSIRQWARTSAKLNNPA